MKLRLKIIGVFLIMVCTAALIIGYLYVAAELKKEKEVTSERLVNVSQNAAGRFSDEIGKMKMTTDQLLSSRGVIEALHSLGNYGANFEGEQFGREDQKRLIKSSVATAFNYDNFYRVIVFNSEEIIAYSASKSQSIVDMNVRVQDIPWLKNVADTKGSMILLAPHKDDWGYGGKKESVFSGVRQVQGKNMGFIEVQQRNETLKNIFSDPQGEITFFVTDGDGNVIFDNTNCGRSILNTYMESGYKERKVYGRPYMFYTSVGEGYRIIGCMQNIGGQFSFEAFLRVAFVPLVFLLIQVLFILWSSHVLTSPLIRLRKAMEQTDLSNMTQPIHIVTKDEDVAALAEAYTKLMERLEDARQREKRLSLMQLRAQYDALQAQTHPHFLYNVLNVLSMRGMEVNDEKICDIAGHLASMLRYSTNTKERTVPLRRELEFLNDYIYLQKVRFEDKLMTVVDIPEEMYEIELPKVLLQQFVENSIEHGYRSCDKVMQIEIHGEVREKAWSICIYDNGAGISAEQIERIRKETKKIRDRINSRDANLELEIGGLGVANAYGRLYLLFGGSTVFEIENNPDGTGTCVYFGSDQEGESLCIQ